ncbi:MAG: type 1 glutamine amidotransferase [Promethearchaeota archaeon]
MDDETLPEIGNRTKILLIDNYSRGFPTDRIARIETIIKESIAQVEFKTVHFTHFKPKIVENYSGIILSGSELNVSSFYYDEKIKKKFNDQLELIRNNNQIPIFALCFGFHLIAYAFGAQISRMRILGLGGRIIFILVKKTDELITQKNIPVNVHHMDFVSPNDCKIQKNFEILSTSRTIGYNMVQYMKHIDKPIFALQFHPETHNAYYFHPSLFDEQIANKTRTVGKEIIENFLWLCSYNKHQKL